MPNTLIRRLIAAALAVLTAGGVAAVSAAPAGADTAGTNVVVSEVYGGGGNSGATYTHDFIELYNPTGADIDVTGWSVQYASSSGTSWQVTALNGTVAAGSHYLVQEAAGAGGTEALPDPDATGSIAMSGTSGKVALVAGASALSCGSSCAAAPGVIDFVGFGNANDFEGTAPAPGLSNTTSASRAGGIDTDDNAADFTRGAPSPAACGADCEVTPPDGGEKTIAEIQGSGDTSPVAGAVVTTTGVVTAAYPTGGFYGFVIQTPGTGGDLDLATHTASDGLYVYQQSGAVTATIGDYVQVTGTVSEFNGLTELTIPDGAAVTALNDAVAAPKPISGGWPTTDAERESIESMLFAGSGRYTVTDTYSTNQYAEIGLAYGTTPLMQPTDVAAPGSTQAAAVAADNAARGVVLDDGASINFLSTAGSGTPLPYVSLTRPLRVGETVTFTHDVIVDYRNNAWKLQPTSQVTAGDTADYPVTWTDNRTAAPDAAALGAGDLRIASFNVLNYFTTLGESVPGCTPYTDRDGHGVTTQSCTGANGPRGAWDAASLQRQQDKIVHAIGGLDADVVGLMEIENSLVVDGPGHTDAALKTLVEALNADAGTTKWAYVPSSSDLPPASEMDVITCAIIYQPAAVQPVGASHALGDQSSAGEAFEDAREPIAQAFAPVAGGDPFVVVVNHFKSKGSAATNDPGDQDSGDGQGASNYTRTRQATALSAWVADTLIPETGVSDVFMTGDFNSYTEEDPLRILYGDGWTDLSSHYATGKQSYSFGGMNGSLDHVLANTSALARTTGADIWNINAPESIALEYSRFHYNVTDFYDDSPYRSSDHDPVIAGFDSGWATAPAWDSRTVYTAGDEVSYDGSVWRAQWWTQNERPGSPWGAWEEIVTAPDGTAVWTPSRVFTAGNVALYQGERYMAKWWTRNQAPGDPWGPWQQL